MRNGEIVAAFERELAAYCGAKYAIAASNGTVTLQAALVALGVKPGDRVAVPPLTMSATTIAVLNVGAVPVFVDVDPATWLMPGHAGGREASVGVSLYGLHGTGWDVDDAAQTLRKHSGAAFTSLSFQASKILSTGEGGALLTNDEYLATQARSYLSLGYAMRADQARIDPAVLKRPDYARHVQYPAVNGRMNDETATLGLARLQYADHRLAERKLAAQMYRDALGACAWMTPQYVSPGMVSDYWAFAVACDTPERAVWVQDRMGALGAEIPYGAWALTYKEPAFKHLARRRNDANAELDTGRTWSDPVDGGLCPVAESLQPRIVAFQTNDLPSAERNAAALRRVIEEAA